MVSIFLATWNEELLLPHTIRYYRSRFPDCEITIYDNFSTDKTVQIAKDMGCKVYDYYTNNKFSDQALIDIKNKCWKNAKYDWVIVCDVDEWLDIYPEHLLNTKATLIRTWFTNMVNMKDDWDLASINKGVLFKDFPGKYVCFNKSKIFEINYDYGAHEANPVGEVVFSEETYLLLHFKYITMDYVIGRYKAVAQRMSRHNLKNRLSFHYNMGSRKIKKEFNWHRKNAQPITLIQRPGTPANTAAVAAFVPA